MKYEMVMAFKTKKFAHRWNSKNAMRFHTRQTMENKV